MCGLGEEEGNKRFSWEEGGEMWLREGIWGEIIRTEGYLRVRRETDSKVPLLKTTPTQVIKHGEIEIVLL